VRKTGRSSGNKSRAGSTHQELAACVLSPQLHLGFPCLTSRICWCSIVSNDNDLVWRLWQHILWLTDNDILIVSSSVSAPFGYICGWCLQH
jgi:hypothetical protein